MSLEKFPNPVVNFSDTDLASEEKHCYCFKSFKLKPFERQLLRNGDPVALTPKAFDILTLLVENAGHLVKKEEIMEKIWADSFVEEANLARLIHTLRRTLGEEDNGNKFIETVAKQGYRFVAKVEIETERLLPPVVDPEPHYWPNVVSAPNDPGNSSPLRGSTARPILLIGFGAAITLGLIVILSVNWPGGGGKGGFPSLAVLPFRQINTTNRDDAIDQAFAFDLIRELNQSHSLNVKPFNMILKYSNSGLSPTEIGIEQNVSYVLVPNYFVVGDRVKGESELYNTATGTVVNTFHFEGTNAQLFGLAENVASSIGPRLLAHFNADPGDGIPKTETGSEEAWRSYYQGMILSNKRSVLDARKAIPEFEKALRLAPNWAPAYVGLTHAMLTVWINGGGEASELCPRLTEVSQRALELDPSNGEAYNLLGSTRQYCSWDVPAAFKARQLSLELSPNSAMIRRYYAVNIMNLGRFEEALEHLTIARELEPKEVWNEKLVGRVLFFARRWDEAIAQSIKAKDLDPEIEQTSFVFMAYELKGDLDKAMEWFLVVESLKKGTTEADLNSWRNTYAEFGWQGVLRRRLERAEEAEKSAGLPEEKVRSYAEIGVLAVQIGDHDKAFPYIEKAVDTYPLFAAQLKIDPYLDPIRSDPRYEAILARTWGRVRE